MPVEQLTNDDLLERMRAYRQRTPQAQSPAPQKMSPPPAQQDKPKRSYATKLQPHEEPEFQQWVKQNKIPWQDSPTADYDMRGYWKAMKSGDPHAKQASNKHFPDTWKTPYHKTFSNESIYATHDSPRWQGNRLVDKSGRVVADESPAPKVASKDTVRQLLRSQGVGFTPQKEDQSKFEQLWNNVLQSPVGSMIGEAAERIKKTNGYKQLDDIWNKQLERPLLMEDDEYANFQQNMKAYEANLKKRPMNFSNAMEAVMMGVTEAGVGLTTGKNVLLMYAMEANPSAAVRGLTGAGFGVQMAVGAVEQYLNAKQQYQNGDPLGAIKSLTGGSFDAAFSAMGLKGIKGEIHEAKVESYLNKESQAKYGAKFKDLDQHRQMQIAYDMATPHPGKSPLAWELLHKMGLDVQQDLASVRRELRSMKQMKDLAVQTETPFAATSSGERMRTALNKVLGGQPVRTGEVKPEDIEGSTAKFVPLEQGGFGIQPPPPPPAPVQGLLHGDISVQDGQTRFGVNLLQKLVSDGNLSVPEAVQRFHQVVGESGTKILAGLKRGQVLIDNRGRQWRFDGESLSRVPGNQMPGANRAMADWAAGVETAKPEKYRVIDQNGALKPDQKAIDIAARSRVNARPVSPAEARPEMGKVSEKITEATKTPPRPAPIYSPVEREPVRDKQDLAEAQRTVEEYQRTAEQPSFLKGLNAYWNWRDRGREEVGVMSLRPPEEEGAQLISELNEIAERNNYAGYEDLITSLQRQREYGRPLSPAMKEVLALNEHLHKLQARIDAQTPKEALPPPLPAAGPGERVLPPPEVTTPEGVARKEAQTEQQGIEAATPEEALTLSQSDFEKWAESRIAMHYEDADIPKYEQVMLAMLQRGNLDDAINLQGIFDVDNASPKFQQAYKVAQAALEGRLSERAARLKEAEDTMRKAAAKPEADADDKKKLEGKADEAKKAADEADKKAQQAAQPVKEADNYPLKGEIKQVVGSAGEISLVDGRKLAFHYAIVPAGELILSHNPNTWEPVEDYPKVAQPRSETYATDKDKQRNILLDSSEKFEPRRQISDDVTPDNGPAIVRRDGVVLGGNGRTMRTVLAYRRFNVGALYRDLLAEKAGQFGLTPEKVPPTSAEPVLVRVLDEDVTGAKELRDLGITFNQQSTSGFTEQEEAILAANALTPDHLEKIAAGIESLPEEATIKDYIRGRMGDVIQVMQDSRMFAENQRAQYIRENPKSGQEELTDKGQLLFEDALLGKWIDDASILKRIPDALRNKLGRLLSSGIRMRTTPGIWDISDYAKDALDLQLVVDAKRSALNKTIDLMRDRFFEKEEPGKPPQGLSEREVAFLEQRVPETQGKLKVGKVLPPQFDGKVREMLNDISLVDLNQHPENYPMTTESLFKSEQGTDVAQVHPITEAFARLLEEPTSETRKPFAKYVDDAQGKQTGFFEPVKPWESFNENIAGRYGIDVKDDDWGRLEAAAKIKAEAPKAGLPPALPETFTVAKFQDALNQIKGVNDEQRTATMSLVRALAKGRGMSVDDFLSKYVAGVEFDTPIIGRESLAQEEPTLPGFEESVAEQKDAAEKATGERLTEELTKPKADISRAAGEMEIKSPLFRDSEASGQGSLFQKGKEKKGATEWLEDGRALIHIFKKGDVSTLAHEFIHVVEPTMTPEEAAIVERWVEKTRDKWGTKEREQFAYGFERYLRDGEAPNEELKGLFAQFKAWLSEVYKSLVGTKLAKDISPEMKALYGKLLGVEGELPPSIGKKESWEIPSKEFISKYSPAEGPALVHRNEDGSTRSLTYRQAFDEKLIDKKKYDERFGGLNEKQARQMQGKAAHHSVVYDALIAGKSVPPEVQAEYPDLVEKYGKKSKAAEGELPPALKGEPLNKFAKGIKKNAEQGNEFYALGHPRADVERYPASDHVPENKYAGDTDAEAVKFLTSSSSRIGSSMPTGMKGKERIKFALDESRKDLERLRGQYEKARAAGDKEGVARSYSSLGGAIRDVRVLEKALGGAEPMTPPPGAAPTDEVSSAAAAADKSNALFKDTEGALGRLKQKLGKQPEPVAQESPDVLFQEGQRLEPETVRDLVEYGGGIYEAAPTTFLRWSRQMIADVGPQIRPYLGEVYFAIKNEALRRAGDNADAAKKFHGMDVPGGVKGETRPDSERAPSNGPGGSEATAGAKPTIEPPPGLAGGDQERKPVQVVRPAGQGASIGRERGRPSESSTALAKVPAAPLDPPLRPRGPADADPGKWADRMDTLLLPANAPAPTHRISDDTRALLIFPGQPEVVEMAISGLNQQDAFILSTTTGTGKTYTSSAVIKEMAPRKALIIAPNQTVIDSPGNGWKDVGFNIFGQQYKDLPAGIAVPEEPGTYITTWDSAKGREGIERGDWDLVVVDEAHKGRNWFKGTANGKMLKDIGTSATVKKVLYVSATPFHNAAEVGLYEKAGMWKKMGFDKWAGWFGVRYDNQKGEYYIPFAPRKLAKLREQMIERGVFVNQDRNMEGYHAAFGVVKMNPEQKETLRKIDRGFTLAENYFAQRRSGKLVMATRAMRVTFTKNWLERTRLPEIVQVGKKLEKAGYRAIFMVENMNERTEIYDFFKRIEKQDPALYSELQDLLPPLPGVVETLKAEFGDNIANFSGAGASPKGELEEFNKDRKQHLFTSYAKGGTGVSFHDTSEGGKQPRAIVYLGLPWSGVMLDQAIGRPWRYGTTSDVLAVFLTSNARPEMELVASKIAPRLSSLRASVSGVNLNDPILQAFHSLDGAIDYGEFGGGHKADFGDFKSQVDTPGVTSWDQMKIPDAKEMQGKGMKYAGEGTDLDEEGNRVPGRVLYQDVPPDLPEFDDGSYNRQAEKDLKDGFISPSVPGATDPAARRAVADMREPERKAFASAVATDARLEHSDNPAASQGDRFVRDGAAQTAWRRAMDTFKHSDIGETVEAGKHGAKGIDRYFLTHGREVLRKMGPYGKQIADAMIPDYADRSNNYGGEMTIKFYDILKKHGFINGPHDFFKKIAKATPESQKLVDILEGNAQPANANEANFAHDLRQWFYEAQDKAVEHKVRVDFVENGRKRSVQFPNARDDNYWPRRYPKGFRQGVRWKNAVESVMEQRGLGKSQAEDFLESKYRDYPLAGHVEKARQGDFEGYRKDLGVMLQYATELGEAMARSDVFGQNREKLDGVIAHIDSGVERKNATSVMDSLLTPKIYDREAKGLVKFASDVVVLTKMPFSMLPALSQTAKAGIFANNRSTLTAIFRMMKDYNGVWEAALESGSILPQAQQHLLREMGATGIAEKALTVYGFNMAHYFGRLVASESAKVFIEKYALPELRGDPQHQGKKAQYMDRILKEKFGQTQESIDAAIRNGRWQEEDYERASSRNTNITQFRYDQTETPPAWAINPKANPKEQMAEAFIHTMLLLQRTAFRNGVLMKEALINEAKKGNFRPWLVVAAAVSISDELLADMYDAVSRPDDPRRLTSLADPNYYTPENLAKRELENLTFHGGIGMVKMFLEPIKYGVSMFEIAAGPFFGNLLSMGDLMLKQWPQQKNWHKRWLSTWRFMRRSAPILRPVERTFGVPFETKQEKNRRLRQNEKYDRQKYGTGGRTDNQWMTPPPLGGAEDQP